MEASVVQCPTLCDPMDGSLPCSFVHGSLQAIILGWVAIPFSRGSPGFAHRSPALQADSLPSQPRKKSQRMEQAGIISEGSMVPGLLPSPLPSLLLLALT